jgi:uncharacterized protein YyaL (SSP411 family)
MRTGDGLFTSSLDADSEGVEGKYYTWDRAGIESVLGDDTEAFFSFFALASPPDWEGDTAILRRVAPAAREEARVAGMLERLRQARGRRIRPARDDKVIVEWNGLAIRALAQVARQLDRPDWLDVAAATFRNVTESTRSGRLPHSMLGTSRQFPALSSDYAALINAAVTLHEATSSPEYLDQAAGLLDMLERWHGDGDGSYFLTSSDAEDVPMRVRGDVDEATSSANSLVIDAIGRLASARADPALAGRAERAAVAAAGRATARRHGQAGILNAVLCVMEPRRLVIVEPKGASLFVPEANRAPDPRRVDIVVDCRTDGTADSLPDGTRIDPARPAAYLCLGTRCLPPVGSATALRSLLTDPEKAA